MKTIRRETQRPGGFTLLELLVVVVIVVLVSAATLPVVIPAITQRQVGEGARLLQATLAGARDAAIRSNAPRGVRLLPDPAFPGPNPLAANRMIAIEPAPDYIAGQATIFQFNVQTGSATAPGQISISEASWKQGAFGTNPNEPTSWYWNIRQGEKIRFDDSGRYYTIAGPMQIGPYTPGPAGGVTNPDRFINFGPPGSVPDTRNFFTGTAITPPFAQYVNDVNPLNAPGGTGNGNHVPEILYLVNGQDDDGDGWVDEGFDGIDNDGDGIIDPGYNGIDDGGIAGVIDDPAELFIGNEYEPEQFIGSGSQFSAAITGAKSQDYFYTIVRRPVISQGAREVPLPQGVVIDMTTWNASSTIDKNGNPVPMAPERSRVPIDPYSYAVDIMINPNGQVAPAGPGQMSISSSLTPTSSLPFYHFWVTEREDVFSPLWGMSPSAVKSIGGVPIANYPTYPKPPGFLLPMPKGTPNYPYPDPVSKQDGPYLTADRRLVTLYVRTGNVITNEIEAFDAFDTTTPFYPAEFGTREAK